MDRLGETETAEEETPILSALSAIPMNFASREEVRAFLKNPLFREPPEEEDRREDEELQFEFTENIRPRTRFGNIEFFHFILTGMSVIAYGEALDNPGKFCVAKFINPKHFHKTGIRENIDRFNREREFLSRHQENPLWVRIQKTGEESHPFLQGSQRCPYMILDFCPGIDGDHFCKAPAFREASANPAFLSAFALASLKILSDVSSEKRTFRDFKPNNVMITSSGFTFLDPGIITEANSDLTPVGLVIGTPEFMSPEQARKQPLDFRSDLYSLGVCLFYFATKKIPFDEMNGMEIMLKHIQTPVPIERLNHLPVLLRTIIHRLLAKNPLDRFSTLEEAANCFRPFVWGTEMEKFLPRTLVYPPSFMPARIDE